MKAFNFHLADYLQRIGFAGEPRADLATVTQMMQRQARTVPFENLDVQAGKLVSIVPEDIVAKIIPTNRGGYCYEVNSLFAMALEALGVRYRLIGARPIVGSVRKARTHMIIMAFVDGGEWLCDTGYGRFGLRQPIDLSVRNTPIRQDFDTYRLVDGPDEDLKIEVRLGGDEGDNWNGAYTFNLSPFELVDFVPANYFNSTSPDAIFRQILLLVRHTETGRHVLAGDSLKTYERGVLTERKVELGELESVVRDLFSLQL